MTDNQPVHDLAVRFAEVIEQLWMLVYLMWSARSAEELEQIKDRLKVQQGLLEEIAAEMQAAVENQR